MDNQLLKNHCDSFSTLKTDKGTIAHTVLAINRLHQAGLTPAPALASDIVTVALGVNFPATYNISRDNAAQHYRQLRMLHTALGKAAGPASRGGDRSNRQTRLRRSLLLLQTLCAGAPHLMSAGIHRMIDLEVIAFTKKGENLTEAEKRWVQWRRKLENDLKTGHDPRFAAALLQLRQSGGAGFLTTDEGIWHLQGAPVVDPVHIEATARHSSGNDREFFRDVRGPFEEIRSHALPPVPSRLTGTDLAMLGARMPEARAMIASKMSDSSFLVRFGSIDRPARRRARCLLVIALCDRFHHHRHEPDRVAPEVDFLREVLVHAIPLCLRIFTKQKLHATFEIRRDSPVRSGQWRAQTVYSKAGRPVSDLASSAAARNTIISRMPWMLDDAPDHTQGGAPPDSAGFDARFLLHLGGEPPWLESFAPTTNVCLLTNGVGKHTIAVRSQRVDCAVSDSSGMSAVQIAPLLAENFGTDPHSDHSPWAGGSQWERTILS